MCEGVTKGKRTLTSREFYPNYALLMISLTTALFLLAEIHAYSRSLSLRTL